MCEDRLREGIRGSCDYMDRPSTSPQRVHILICDSRISFQGSFEISTRNSKLDIRPVYVNLETFLATTIMVTSVKSGFSPSKYTRWHHNLHSHFRDFLPRFGYLMFRQISGICTITSLSDSHKFTLTKYTSARCPARATRTSQVTRGQ